MKKEIFRTKSKRRPRISAGYSEYVQSLFEYNLHASIGQAESLLNISRSTVERVYVTG